VHAARPWESPDVVIMLSLGKRRSPRLRHAGRHEDPGDLRWKRGSAFARAFIVSLCCDDTVQPAAA